MRIGPTRRFTTNSHHNPLSLTYQDVDLLCFGNVLESLLQLGRPGPCSLCVREFIFQESAIEDVASDLYATLERSIGDPD